MSAELIPELTIDPEHPWLGLSSYSEETRAYFHGRDEETAELARRLQLVGLHPPKRAFEIPEPFARAYFDLMPIHKSLRASEFPTLHNYLKVTLCNVHEELTKRMDGPALVAALLEEPDGQQAAHEA